MERRRVATTVVLIAALTALVPAARADAVLVNVAPGGWPHVRVLTGNGSPLSEWQAYPTGFTGGASVAMGDVNGDGALDVITGAGPGGGAEVKVFTLGGGYFARFDAYDSGFRGGVRVAAGDIDNDGRAEIITGPGAGGAPHVRVFNGAGGVVREWMAYVPGFSGGVQVGAGDLDGDGRAEVVTGPGPSGGPHVRVFDGLSTAVQDEWMAYSTGFTGGVNVGVGGNRVVTGAGAGGGPHVRVFTGNGGLTDHWFAYDPTFSGGVMVAAGVVDGAAAVVTGAGQGGGPHVRVFSPSGASRSGFFAYPVGYGGGVNVAAGGGRVVTGAGAPRVIEVLRPGDRGPAVSDLQQRLLNSGYWLPAVDAHFGDGTIQAVWAFQKANGLPRDGAIGLEDRAALERGARPAPLSGSGDLVEVDKARQLLFVIRGGRMVWTFNTSTGNNQPYSSGGRTHRAVTPEGRFTFSRQVDGMRVSHLGQLFRPKYFTSAGHAIHGSPSIPPYPASHGCVRLSNAAINFIWAANLAPLGSQIWVHS